jgi:HSP20 family protein
MATEVNKRSRRESARAHAENLVNLENAALAEADIFETEDHLYIRADLPGVEKGNVHIEVDEDNTLQIRAKHSFQEPSGPIYKEFEATGFYRSFRLGDGYDKEKISAQIENGTLEIDIPKREEVKPRRIALSA